MMLARQSLGGLKGLSTGTWQWMAISLVCLPSYISGWCEEIPPGSVHMEIGPDPSSIVVVTGELLDTNMQGYSPFVEYRVTKVVFGRVFHERVLVWFDGDADLRTWTPPRRALLVLETLSGYDYSDPVTHTHSAHVYNALGRDRHFGIHGVENAGVLSLLEANSQSELLKLLNTGKPLQRLVALDRVESEIKRSRPSVWENLELKYSGREFVGWTFIFQDKSATNWSLRTVSINDNGKVVIRFRQ